MTDPKSNICRVEHPRFGLEMQGGSYGPTGTDNHWKCSICDIEFTEHFDSQSTVAKITSGRSYCYSGKHTRKINPLAHDSIFRVYDKEAFVCIEVTSARQAQREIDNLNSEKLESLVICPPYSKGQGYVELDGDFTLNRSFPNLEHLRILDSPPSKLVISEKKTPKLGFLELQNITKTAKYKMTAPSLKILRVRHYGDREKPDGPLFKLIKSAKKLEKFISCVVFFFLHFLEHFLQSP